MYLCFCHHLKGGDFFMRYKEDDVRKHLKDLGFKVLEYKSDTHIIASDDDGYEYKLNYSNIVCGKAPSKLMNNPFALYNFKLYLSNYYPDYELLDNEYINCKTKMRFICHRHMDKGVQLNSPDNIMNNHHACRYCGYGEMGKTRRISESAIKNRCGELNLEYVSRYSKNGGSVVKFMCPKHRDKGIQEISWDHLKTCSFGCSYCAGKNKSTDDFKNEISKKNEDVEIISEYLGYNSPIECRCKKCGNIWETSVASLRQGNGCPKCSSSKGEKRINSFLIENDIKFEPQKTFDECRYEQPLRFDFYLYDLNTCIEYDGECHFTPVDFGGKGYEYAKRQFDKAIARDEIKNQFCNDKGITLIKIPYTDLDNIEEILTDKLMT